MGEIRQQRHDAVVTITIANEHKRNAIDDAMARLLLAALDAAESDPTVRCVILTGSGSSAFCSGHDIDEVIADPEGASAPHHQDAFLRPATMLTPCIGAINGPAYAAGMILALSCDLRIASASATFCAPASRVGLIPLGGQLSRLLYMLPHGMVMEMLLTGRPITADEAHDGGFVNHVVDGGDLLDAARAVAADVARNSPAINRGMKAAVQTTLRDGTTAADDYAYDLAEAAMRLPDWREGLDAVRQKRPPTFPDSAPDFPPPPSRPDA